MKQFLIELRGNVSLNWRPKTRHSHAAKSDAVQEGDATMLYSSKQPGPKTKNVL